MKHTPGPWTFESYRFGAPDAPICHKEIVGATEDNGVSRKLIAELHMQHDTHEVDGRLIAAAPTMYEALERILEEIAGDEVPGTAAIYRWAEEAIRKAKGE